MNTGLYVPQWMWRELIKSHLIKVVARQPQAQPGRKEEQILEESSSLAPLGKLEEDKCSRVVG